MIETIIKRDGSKEAFIPSKLNRWGEWASQTLGTKVDWSSVVLDTVGTLGKECTSQQLQERLIKTCLDYDTWSYNRMAGRLYAALIHKKLYGDKFPTVKELHDKLYSLGLMVKLDYSDEEYSEVESIINHKLDLKSTYYGLHQARTKYSIQNRVTGEEYESQQFIYMRMAMALSEDQPKDRRMKDVAAFYKHFSEKRINAPTPNYVNLGTPLRGYASCCLYTVDDSAKSLAIGDHIAYTMTYMSAGIGSHLNTRSINDQVRGGVIKHQGKLNYFRSLVGAVKANLQNGRGGACTTYFPIYDPEIETILRLKNPMSTEDKKIRGLDYNFGFNKFFARKAAKNEEIFLFNSFTHPDLYKALYSNDEAEFERLYNKYEKEGKNLSYRNARELLITALNESFETGRMYEHNLFEMNNHTPFKETINQSNLCFTGDTLVAVADGRNAVRIDDLAKESNGVVKFPVYSARYSKHAKKWKAEVKGAIAFHNGVKEVVRVSLSNGTSFECTPDHKIALPNGEWVEAKDSIGINVEGFYTSKGSIQYLRDIVEGKVEYEPPSISQKVKPLKKDIYKGDGDIYVTGIEYTGKVVDVYDLTVDDNHNFYIITKGLDDSYLECSGILVHNCAEVTLPTKAYNDMRDLYSEEDHGRGEIAMCNLAGILPANVSEDLYEEVAYYALLMIDKTIHLTHYELPHVGVTAKSRLNAGVGIIGLAHHLAKNKLLYSSEEGKKEIHRIAELHAYSLIKASLRLGKELGNAPWINKTKWPEGWLPIDTYNKNVDSITDFVLHKDWESLRQEIITNGGIRNSAIINHMPSESSSLLSETTNGVYPVREVTLIKTDNNRTTYWAAPEGDRLEKYYESAWDIPAKDLIDMYAIIQKFTDQAISADMYRKIIGDDTVSSTEMIKDFLYRVKMGMKTRYYMNSKTSNGTNLDLSEDDCESCKL